MFRLILLLGLSLVGCSWQSQRSQSVLVIAVEQLAFEHLSCETDDMGSRELEGFKALCEEGVRFTHAYTTSTASQGAVASILTGLYPIEHGVRHNGSDYLAPKIRTVAEQAVDANYRTAFFSGGPPILRKSGLSQGFEVFDDLVRVTESNFYRPAQDVIATFQRWRQRVGRGASYFAVLYLSDLLFPEVATATDLGELRERSLDGQLREIGESLSALVRDLKNRGEWHKTNIILVGTNGFALDRRDYGVAALNVFSESTQVALFMKPARRNPDLGPQWTVDKNVTLADVGHTLFQLLQVSTPDQEMAEELPRVALMGAAAPVDWNDDRTILIESGWGQWRWVSGIRFAARRRQYLYIHDDPPQLYNTLIDRMENTPLATNDPLWITLRESMLLFFQRRDLMPFRINDQKLFDQLKSSGRWWSQQGADLNVSETWARRWLVQRYLRERNWLELQKLGLEQNEPIYSFVAHKNLSQNARVPSGRCTRFFDRRVWIKLRDQVDVVSRCDDALFLLIVDAVYSEDERRRERSLNSFLKKYHASVVDNRVAELNYRLGLIWDVATFLPTGAGLSELFLALPDNRWLQEKIGTRYLREDQAVDL